MAIQKLTIIFPPGDILTSVVWEKEKNTKIVDLLSRLCQLRGLALDKLDPMSDVGKKLPDTTLQQTVIESGLFFIELVDKDEDKKKKKVEEEIPVDDELFDEKAVGGVPKGIKDKIVPGCLVDVPLREQLYDHEWDLLQKFKAKNADLCSVYSDEFVMACLFARKLDVERALTLLQNNLKFRKEKGLMNIPKLSELDTNCFKPMLNCVGTRAKSGHPIGYMLAKESVPGVEPFTVASLPKWIAWYNYVGAFANGIDGFRNGVIAVIDLQDYGWKNFDIEYSKASNAVWQDCFPGRPRKLFIVNQPLIFTAVIKISKTFMKAKMAARFHNIEPKELVNHIDKDHLLASYGGSLNWTHENSVAIMKKWAEKHEARLIAPGRTATN
jgi:hypothetical protein